MAESAEQQITDPHQLITKDGVQLALKAEKGTDAQLVSFEIKDFVTKGDNYACMVSSVDVLYRNPSGEQLETSYVTKLNPCRGDNPLGAMTDIIFEKESGFYTQIVPLLDQALQEAGEGRLRFAKHFHSVEIKDRQVIYLEDLRKLGFQMHNRQMSMDEAHVELIIKELARMHASSALVQKNQAVDLEKSIKVLGERYDMISMMRDYNVLEMFSAVMETTAKLTDQIPGYGFVSEFIKKKKPDLGDILTNLISANEPFKLLSHGDSWNNNFLFRYSATGVPVECRLLDLQITRVASPALDLNHFLFSSTDGPLRRSRLSHFLETYYASFASVLAGTDIPMKFKLSDLKKEFATKHFWGLFWAMMIVPTVLLEPESTPDMDEFFTGDPEAALKSHGEVVSKMMLKSPSLRPRLLDLFDEMRDLGVFAAETETK